MQNEMRIQNNSRINSVFLLMTKHLCVLNSLSELPWSILLSLLNKVYRVRGLSD